MMSLEGEVESFYYRLIEFMKAEDLANVQSVSILMAKTEYELQGQKLDYENSDRWDEKLYQEFTDCQMNYQLDILKELYKKALALANKGGAKADNLFYKYNILSDKEIVSKVKEKLKKEGKN
ncbi:hypothetical protein HY837_04365 [archaeon]|nr:hypothetical protein [archaeon]